MAGKNEFVKQKGRKLVGKQYKDWIRTKISSGLMPTSSGQWAPPSQFPDKIRQSYKL